MSTHPDGRPVAVTSEPVVEEPSIGQLVRRLVDDTGELVRSELKLAQTEFKSNLTAMVAPIGMVVGAAVFGLAALFVLLGAFVGWLTPYVGAGWAALIVAAVTGLIAFLLFSAGRKGLSAASLAPTRTTASLKQDAELLKGNR